MRDVWAISQVPSGPFFSFKAAQAAGAAPLPRESPRTFVVERASPIAETVKT
jgi:hypothetical protein